MLIIQSITTIWGKTSRGGPAAGVRNATPERMTVRLPDPLSTRHRDILLHEVRCGEAAGFEPVERSKFKGITAVLEFGCVRLEMDEERVRVIYFHNWLDGGHPQRFGPVEVGTIERGGGWAQVIYNGLHMPLINLGNVPMGDLLNIPFVKVPRTRFQDPHSLWWYEKHVYNIALTDVVDLDVFTRVGPELRHRNLARLR
jgi:hypothetical protein